LHVVGRSPVDEDDARKDESPGSTDSPAHLTRGDTGARQLTAREESALGAGHIDKRRRQVHPASIDALRLARDHATFPLWTM
jgi:hypothetical protein